MRKAKNLAGQRFGRLTAVKPAGKNKQGRILWLCRCDCGNGHIVSSDCLLRGFSKSCGCLNHDNLLSGANRTTHGEHNTRLYRIWKGMKARCINPNTKSYQKWYGAKGVKICDEWKYNYWVFRNWAILHGYKDNLSIDRIDPYGNYEPSNCRWATVEEQAQNKRGGDSH